MYVNSYKINLATISDTASATTINIPINLEYQVVDQAELVNRVFVDVETEKAINSIVDFEKVRFTPLLNNLPVNKIIYKIDLLGNVNYAQIGFNDEDIIQQKESFKQTQVNLAFYDSDNPLTQNLVTFVSLFSELKQTNLQPNGFPYPANQIMLTFETQNPLTAPNGFAEGYFLYDYKDELKIGESKSLYMRASFKNAKTGKSTNLMVKNFALPIDELIHEIYTKYILTRTNTGYYYTIDTTYQGVNPQLQTNNVTISGGDIIVNLYQINAI